MAQENNSTKSFIMGFLTGSFVGAIIALLYAPKAGKELRSDIKQKASNLKVDAEEYLKIAKQKAIEIVNEGKKQSELLIIDARKKAEDILGDAEKLVSQVRDKTVEEGKKIKDAVQAGVDTYKKERS